MQKILRLAFTVIPHRPNFFLSTQNIVKNEKVHLEIKDKVYEVLKSAAKCKVDKLSDVATFEELGFDSLDAVELIVAIEEKLGYDIQNEEVNQIKKVDDVINAFYKVAVENQKEQQK